jgi:hypothetical protein
MSISRRSFLKATTALLASAVTLSAAPYTPSNQQEKSKWKY